MVKFANINGMLYLVDLIVIIFCNIGAVFSEEGILPVIKEHPSSAVVARNDPFTLKCLASSASQIDWFHDGEKVAPSPHKLLLKVGSLFFLRVSSGKRQNDAGTYWCVASNQYGSTRSNNATLKIATLSSDFQQRPNSLVKSRVGESITLKCKPPKGNPLPKVSWMRDGHEIRNSSRFTVTISGDLTIQNIAKEDAANYICRARNVAGTKQTLPSKLVVLVPPSFKERPANITSVAGSKIELACIPNGIPLPTITWRRLDGKISHGKVEEYKLTLQNIVAEDSGTYACEAKSEAGSTTARATVTVVNSPQFSQRPQNIQVLSGKSAKLSCQIEGNPKPMILWLLPNLDRGNLVTAQQNNSHILLSEDGQMLIIKNASAADSGTYSCWGISSGGGVSAQAEVVVVEAYPPPIIGIGPQDLIIAPGEIASFPCEVVSEASVPSVSWWYTPAAHLPAHQLPKSDDNPRFTLPDNGALIIKNVQTNDSGIYTCKISASTGRVEQEATLRVTNKAKTTTQGQLPAPPSKPRILSVNETNVHLAWLPNSQGSSDSGEWYTIEYWRNGWDEWRVADKVQSEESCVVSQLKPSQVYTFLVRAVNRRGASFPSPWSDPVLTHTPSNSHLTVEQIRQARRRLSRATVILTDTTVKGINSAKLGWKFMVTEEYFEGVLIYAVSADGKALMEKSQGSALTYIFQDLEPNTQYTFFIVPFWQSVEGMPSNSYSLTTPEDAPLVPPSDVHVIAHTDGSTIITWSPLGPKQARGKITGYQVILTHNGTQTKEIVESPWLEAKGLFSERLYTVRVAAITSVGPGPFSAPVLIDAGVGSLQNDQENSRNSNGNAILYATPQLAWLVYLLVPLIIIFFIATLIYVQRLRHKAPPSNPPSGPVLYQDPSIYPAHHSINTYSEQKLWHPQDSDKDSSLSSARLIQIDQKNEYSEPKERAENEATAPYATTTLLVPESPHVHHIKPWMRDHSDDSGVQVNWSTILPPPPSCPPPRDLDLVPKVMYTAASQYDNLGGSLQYKNPCDATSEHMYDVYTQVTPMDHRNVFVTFNSLRRKGCHKLPPDPQEKKTADPPRSNTH